jgi:hypothetical protein
MTMDVLRGRILDRMRSADKHDRLRVYYPHMPGLGDACISVHAKLLIIDDRLLRIGSSNTSNRSMGLDTECDLAIESAQPGDKVSHYIAGLRSRLLAEHLDCAPEDVERATRERDSLVRGIESLRGDERSLRPLDWSISAEVDELVPGADLIDPPEPFSPDYFVEQYVPQSGKRVGRRRLTRPARQLSRRISAAIRVCRNTCQNLGIRQAEGRADRAIEIALAGEVMVQPSAAGGWSPRRRALRYGGSRWPNRARRPRRPGLRGRDSPEGPRPGPVGAARPPTSAHRNRPRCRSVSLSRIETSAAATQSLSSSPCTA